jgi:hypothetical protein
VCKLRIVPSLSTLTTAALFCALIVACRGGEDSGTTTTSPSRTPGQAPGVSATPHPNGLPADRVTFYGADAGDQAGAIVSGDFNGDGVGDVVLGAAFADGPDNARADAGEAYVFLGPFAAGTSLDASAGEYDSVFYGAVAGDGLARALGVGDFNGDGVDDLAMATPAAAAGAGSVYVMFGGGWAAETDFATDEPDVLLTGADAGDYAGFTLTTADLDGDGTSELLVSAMLGDGPQNARADAGEVYVLSGRSLLAGSTISLSQATDVVYGARAGDRLGEGLAAGDVTGDGKPDLILVATFGAGPDGSRAGAGETYVVASPAALPLDLASAPPALTVIGADAGDQLGHSVGAGDTDGDGAADLWLGAVSADGPGNAVNLAGEAALVTGKRAPGTVIDTAAGQASAIIYGPEREARFGRSLAVGDVNGDHLADLAISAPNLDGRSGRIFILNGRNSYPDDAGEAGTVFYGLDAGDMLGFEEFGMPSLAIADVNADGLLDILASAAGGDGPSNDRADCGEAYVLLSASPPG